MSTENPKLDDPIAFAKSFLVSPSTPISKTAVAPIESPDENIPTTSSTVNTKPVESSVDNPSESEISSSLASSTKQQSSDNEQITTDSVYSRAESSRPTPEF